MAEQSPIRSEAAREASRTNGKRSRGPLSYVGRQISSRNAFKHGLRGRLSAEPAFLPAWLKRFDQKVVKLFGYFSQRRRECLDRSLVNMLLVQQADRLITEELGRLHWLIAGGPAPEPSKSADLVHLEKLFKYRRRFAASRDRGISRIVADGPLMALHALIRDRHVKLRLERLKKRRRSSVPSSGEA